jgi:TIR domain
MVAKPHIFISRAGEDAEYAKWVAKVLEAEGYTTTLQDLDFRPGNSFAHEMSKAQKRADHVIALLSPHYVAKEFTLNELYTAFVKDGLGETRRLIPVRIEPCEIPDVINHIVFVDLVGKDKSPAARDLLLDAVSPDGPRKTVAAPRRAFIGKLPAVDPTLLGRDAELAFLDRAWADPAANMVQIIAAGGTGKTALVDKWFRRHLGEATVFGWSFYSQGTSENRQTSSDPFFADVLRFFKITVEPTASVYAKAEALADHLRKERVLLLLDGCEPLQDTAGDMKDSALKALLQELATQNKGLVVCTTRVRINDVPDDPPRARSIDLDNLDPEHGAAYLRHLGVEGTEVELREASEAYKNHALALTLLGNYLVDFCDKDVRRRVEIPKLMIEDVKAGVHARHVMEGYARRFAGKPELEILRALSYFDRPAEPAA